MVTASAELMKIVIITNTNLEKESNINNLEIFSSLLQENIPNHKSSCPQNNKHSHHKQQVKLSNIHQLQQLKALLQQLQVQVHQILLQHLQVIVEAVQKTAQ